MRATYQNILSAAGKIHILLGTLKGLKEASKTDPLIDRLGDPFVKAYTLIRLFFQKRELFTLLDSCESVDDPRLYLEVGNILQKAEEYSRALSCFERAIILIDDCWQQDTRLSALMGELECLIALQEDLYWQGKTDDRMKRESEEFYMLICEDLSAASVAIQKSLKGRLCKARFAMDQLAMRIKVRWVSAMLKRCRFGYPD